MSDAELLFRLNELGADAQVVEAVKELMEFRPRAVYQLDWPLETVIKGPGDYEKFPGSPKFDGSTGTPTSGNAGPKATGSGV